VVGVAVEAAVVEEVGVVDYPAVADDCPVVVDDYPVVADDEYAVVADDYPVVADDCPAVVDDYPAADDCPVADDCPAVVDDYPAVDDYPVVADDCPAVADDYPMEADDCPVGVVDYPVVVDDYPVVVDDDYAAMAGLYVFFRRIVAAAIRGDRRGLRAAFANCAGGGAGALTLHAAVEVVCVAIIHGSAAIVVHGSAHVVDIAELLLLCLLILLLNRCFGVPGKRLILRRRCGLLRLLLLLQSDFHGGKPGLRLMKRRVMFGHLFAGGSLVMRMTMMSVIIMMIGMIGMIACFKRLWQREGSYHLGFVQAGHILNDVRNGFRSGNHTLD
jgi:hypothetical protein